MADGLHAGDSYGHATKIQKSLVKIGENVTGRAQIESLKAPRDAGPTPETPSSDQFVNLRCTQQNGARHEGLLDDDEECRKKRCVDRYDSSESSDRYVKFVVVIVLLNKSSSVTKNHSPPPQLSLV